MSKIRSLFSKNSILSVIIIAYFIAIGVYLELMVPFHITFKEQTSIFIYGQDLIWNYFRMPAALSRLIGDFCTQFFAFRHTGTLIIIFLFAVLFFSVRKSLNILSGQNTNLAWGAAFLVTSVECALFTGIDWDITLCIGQIIALGTFIFLSKCRNRLIQYFLIAIAFPLIGGYMLMLAMLIICYGFKHKRYIEPIVIAAVSFLVILLFSRMEMLYMGQAVVYPLDTHSLSVSPYNMFITFAIMLVFHILSELAFSNFKAVRISIYTICAASCILAFVLIYDRNDEHILELSTYTYKRDWEKAEKASASINDNNNLYDILVHNCALARKCDLPNKLFKYPQIGLDGMYLDVTSASKYIDHFFNVDFHLELGDLTWATDCSFLGQTQVRGRMPSRMIRRSAEIAIIAGDSALAEKYLNILSHSIPHKKWAAEVQNGLRFGRLPQYLVKLKSLTPESDIHFNQNDHEAALLSVIEGNRNNKIALDYLLCAYILDKDLKSFARTFHSYYNWKDKTAIPQIYQEALIASAPNMDKLKEVAEMYNLNSKLLTAYMQFSKAVQTGDRKTVRKFSGSYWDYLLTYGK